MNNTASDTQVIMTYPNGTAILKRKTKDEDHFFVNKVDQDPIKSLRRAKSIAKFIDELEITISDF
jgi:hypothetical protein